MIVLAAAGIGLIVGLMGSGGSVMTVPLLVYVVHHEPTIAVAESMAIVACISSISAIPYMRAGQVGWSHAWLLGLPGMLGAVLGAWVSVHFLSGATKLILLALIMFITAMRMLRKPRMPKGPQLPHESTVVHEATAAPPDSPDLGARITAFLARGGTPIIATQGFVIGLVAGVVGVGGGFLIVPTLVLACGQGIRQAIATSLIVITLQSVLGFLGYQWQLLSQHRSLHWETVGLFAVVGSLSGLLGQRLGQRLHQDSLRRGFAILLLVLGGMILVRESINLARPRPRDATPHALRGASLTCPDSARGPHSPIPPA